MNTENSKTDELHRFRLSLVEHKNIALANLSIYHTWKNICNKSAYNNNTFNISAPIWNDVFDLPDGLWIRYQKIWNYSR